MREFLFKKKVDESLLKSGLTIPVKAHDAILNRIGVDFGKGAKINIMINIQQKVYEAKLSNVDLSQPYGDRTVYQIRYSEGSDICQRLKQIFYASATDDTVDNEYMEVYSLGGLHFEFVTYPALVGTDPIGETKKDKEIIEDIKKYIKVKGFTYADGMIENFYLSLKSKPFVLLAGISGTGKTRLAKLFAEAVGSTSANGRYKMVSVRPDWSDSSDLFGHVDLNGKFVPGVVLDFVKQAEENTKYPYFLCLDEMNLARVEYYLSDVLSVIETRDIMDGRIVSDPLVPMSLYGGDAAAERKYGNIQFPENLYIIGTVNMDETTFPFSKKVLDRANTIEFSYVDLLPPDDDNDDDIAPLCLTNDFFKTKYLFLNQCKDELIVYDYCLELQKINIILQKANAHVGYRVRDEIAFYLLNNLNADLLDEKDAMDNEIMQKILTRIQGSSASVKNMLCELFKLCSGNYDGIQSEDDIGTKMLKIVQNSDCKYKKSAEKIAFMVRRYEEDGFTSYWL